MLLDLLAIKPIVSDQTRSDKGQIEKVVADYVTYWNRNDIESWGELFTGDVDYINRRGGWWKSNEENIEEHKQIHRMLVESKQPMSFFLRVESIEFLHPGIALAHVRSEWPGFFTGGKPQNLKGIMTIVLKREKSRWKIRALHNSLISGGS